MDSVKFNLGELVYLIADDDSRGIVTGILFRPGSVLYYIGWGNTSETSHYDIELAKVKSLLGDSEKLKL